MLKPAPIEWEVFNDTGHSFIKEMLTEQFVHASNVLGTAETVGEILVRLSSL